MATPVQVVQSSGAGSSLTVTIAATGTGNTLIVCIDAAGTTTNPSVSTVKLGGVTDNFASLLSAGTTASAGIVGIWADPGAAPGQTSVAITTTGGSGTLAILATVFELPGVFTSSPLDKSDSGVNNTASASWSSGTTAATTTAPEFIIGYVAGFGATTTVAGPSSPWTNETLQRAASNALAVAGWNYVTSTGTQIYNGTFGTANSPGVAAVVTLKTAAIIAGAAATMTLSPLAGTVAAGAVVSGAAATMTLSAPAGSTAVTTPVAPAATGYLAVPPAVTWTSGNNAVVTTLAPFTPDLNGPPVVTPWFLPFSGFVERLPQSWDANLRGLVQASIVDAWAGVNYTPNPILFCEILNDQPWAYWPCSDPPGSSIASNLAPGSVVPLQVTQSKSGTSGVTQTFGASTSTLPGTAGTLLLTPQGSFRSSTQAGMWQQSYTTFTAFAGYSLTYQGINFPGSTGSLEFWFQTSTATGGTAPSGGGPAALLMLGNNIPQSSGSFALNGITILLGALPALGGTGFLYVAQNPTLAESQISPSTNYWANNTPVTHVCLTWTSATWIAYINGQQSATGSWPATMPGHLSYLAVNGTNGYPYGQSTTNPSGTVVSQFPGVMGHIALYDYILPQPRILTHYVAGFKAFTGENAAMRIERLLQAGQATGRRLIYQDAGANVTAAASTQDISGQPASQSIANLTTDLVPGMFLVTPNGDLTYLAKQQAWNQPVAWFLGEDSWSGEITYDPDNVIFEFDPTRILNQIQITQLDNQDVVVPSVTAQQTASQLAYGTVSYEVTGYLEGDLTVSLSFGPGLLDLADWLATRYAAPSLRLSSVTVEATSQPSAWQFVLKVSPGDMIQVTRRPIGQQPFSVIGRVTQTERQFGFGYQGQATAKVTCTVDPAPEYLCLTCDDPARGILNGTTNILGWLQMPFPTLPSLPAPVTWGTLAQIKAPQLRADVSNAVQLFAGPPFFSGAYLGVSTAVPGGGAITPVPIDTEYADPWTGHQIGTIGNPNNPRYYPKLAGWYLAQAAVPMYPVVTGTTAGATSAGIQAVTNGAGSNSFFGQRLPNQNSSGSLTPLTMPVACKLIKQVQVGNFGTGDWIAPAVSQNSGGLLDLNNLTAGQTPYFSAQWVCGVTGTEPLPVPTNDNFAVPPQIITHAFMNKNVRDTINFLGYVPVMECQYDNGTNTLASQSTIPATGTTIGLDTVVVDNYSTFSNSTNTWTAPVSGIYFCYGQVALSVTANSLSAMAGFTISSANYNGGSAFTYWGGAQLSYIGSAFPNCAFTRRRLRLNAGDTVKLAGWQRDSGAAANTILGTTTNWTTRLGIVWEGA